MVVRYSYEFKTFKSGNRKGEEFCNIRSVKTGKTVRTVSSKANLSSAHKSVGQQKRRAAQDAEWKSVEGVVTKRGGTRKQYETARTRLTKEEKQRLKEDKKAGPRRKKFFQTRASEKTGYTTTIRAFYQVASTPKAQPHTVGESDSERDVDIEYSGWQTNLDGDNFEYNIEELRRDFRREIEEAETSELQVFYGGYEIKVIDNESGDVIRKEKEGGYYPSKKLRDTQPKAKTSKRRSSSKQSRF